MKLILNQEVCVVITFKYFNNAKVASEKMKNKVIVNCSEEIGTSRNKTIEILNV